MIGLVSSSRENRWIDGMDSCTSRYVLAISFLSLPCCPWPPFQSQPPDIAAQPLAPDWLESEVGARDGPLADFSVCRGSRFFTA